MADNDWQQQVLMNEAVFSALTSNGEDLSDGRHVIHYFYDGDVNGLKEVLGNDGYVVSSTQASPGVIAEIFAVTDRNWSESEMKKMCDLANRFGAEYDGWEASMVRQGKQD
ncbi:ribonuclease E inhibitor RraB [Sphingomonas sp.]|uniref:ribonuclease E inhibitor RraB n=1 Tax=Sphingomonas sp. TaxID=28214 RepID=UPI0025FF042A|nr:ribonuclease E inhibitor RraB [Sphingomonas sp.]